AVRFRIIELLSSTGCRQTRYAVWEEEFRAPSNGLYATSVRHWPFPPAPAPAPSSLPLAHSARHDISRPLRNPFCVSFTPSGEMVTMYAWPSISISRLIVLSSFVAMETPLSCGRADPEHSEM